MIRPWSNRRNRGRSVGGGKALAGALVLLLLALLPAVSQGVERRRSQYLKEQAYLVIPFPFNIPGIGSGIAVTGLAANIGGGNTDAFGIIITGDASGTIVRVSDFHLIEEKLILSVTYQRISRAVINNYETRGMDSDPNAFNLLELSQADGQEIELCLCLFEKKLQFFLGMEFDESTIERVRNSNGEIIGDFDQPIRGRETTRRIGVIIDNSDDLSDPRKGIRFALEARRSPPRDGDDPDFIVLDLSLGFYIPMGKISTLVLNYFQSDARVSRQGQTDPTALRNELGLNCTTPECNAAVDALVERRIAENRFGTATSLGGAFSRLRSYPVGRFQGAHMVFYGAEFRWNLTDEATPFDYFIWKDVRSSLQLAFFAETGSVAESRSGLEKFKSSYGLGIRLISASGFVYRADLATGDEGTETVIIFGYPF